MGPTASGKTAAAIALARHYNTEIISFDSRQFYNEMSVGTAKPSAEELSSAQHHFIGHKSVVDHYTAGLFARDADDKLAELFKKHGVVIAVGGSGLFLKAWTEGLDEMPQADEATRFELQTIFEREGISPLQRMLLERDEAYYRRVDLFNPRRLIRALEVSIAAGRPYSSFLQQTSKSRDYALVKIGLSPGRKELYERIDARVDLMMQHGLVEEAKRLLRYRDLKPLQTVGYSELFEFFDGTVSLESAVEKIKRHTRNYAKRQFTWFRKDKPDVWMESFDLRQAIATIHAKR